MTITTTAQRQEVALKDLTRLANKWVANHRKSGIRVANVDCSFFQNEFTVQMDISEANQCSASELSGFITSKSDLLIATTKGHQDGEYDWDSDYYRKPMIWASFKL